MKKMIVLMIGLGVILGGCRKKEKQEAASGQAAPEILVNRPAQHGSRKYHDHSDFDDARADRKDHLCGRCGR